MCELEPSVSTVPGVFITRLELHVLPVSIEYLQEDILRESIAPRTTRPSKTTAERPLSTTEE